MDNGRNTKWEEFYKSHYSKRICVATLFSIGHVANKKIITTQNIKNCIIKTQMAKGRS
jgi:hypothetical protein